MPATDVLISLRQFSAQSGEQLLYSADAIGGVKTAAIKGSFTSQRALDLMLAGTGLAAVRDKKTAAFTIFCHDLEAHRAAQENSADDPLSKKKLPGSNNPHPLPSQKSTASQDPAARRAFGRSTPFPGITSAGNARTDKEVEYEKEGEMIVLSPFQVSTAQDKGYQATNTLSGFGTDTPINKLPQTIQVANQQLIQDLGLGSGDLISALEVASSSVVRRSYNNGDDQFMWGFRLNNSIRDGVPVGTANPTGVFYDIERIEAIKGPAAALFGQASAIGGVINYVPRQPTRTAKYRVEVAAGTFNTKTAAVHASGPILPQFRYRLDLGWADNGGQRQFSFYKDKFLGAGFEFDISPAALVCIDLGESWAHRMNSWTIMDLNNTGRFATTDPRLGDKLSVNSPFDDYASARSHAGGKILITLPGGFSSMTSLSWTQVRLDLNRTQVQSIRDDRNSLSRISLYPFVVNEHNTFFVQSFFKSYKTGFLTHKLGLSLDARFQTSVSLTKSARDPGPYPADWTNASYITPQFDLNSPVYPHEQRLISTPATGGTKINNRITGGTLYDMVSFWENKISLMFNFRYNDQLQTSGLPFAAYQSVTTDPVQTVAAGSVLTRRYAATVEPAKDILFFYNVGQAFIFNPGLDWLNNPLVPSIGENSQIGANLTFFDGAVTVTASHFDIEVSHVRIVFVQGPNDPFPGSSSVAQAGAQTNQGYDLGINLSKTFEAGKANAIITDYHGNLRDESGSKVQHTVNNTTSFWGSFDFSQTFLKGIRVGLGANYVGERVGPTTVPQALGGVRPTRIEAYWKSRAMIAYNRKNFGIQLNVDNIAGKKAILGWESSLWMHTEPGRAWKLSANYNF